MSDFIHSREYLNQGDVVVVQCTHQCNVKITDDVQFENLRHGREHSYYGGFYERLPAKVAVPHTGYWNITLDLGGGAAKFEYSINVLRRAA